MSSFSLDKSRSSVQLSESDSKMQLSNNVKTLCSRVQTMLRQRRRKQKRSLQISAPFNLKREPATLPGISEDELAMLREKAAASRIGIADPTSPRTRSPRSQSGLFLHPVKPASIKSLPHAAISTSVC